MSLEMPTRNTVEPIRIGFGELMRPVVVTPENRDRFVITSEEAARACHQADLEKNKLREWQMHFERYLAHLNAWARDRTDIVSRIYVAAGPDGLQAFIVTPGNEYCFELDDPITELDMEILTKFPDCPSHVMQIPEDPADSVDSFFSADTALQVHGD